MSEYGYPNSIGRIHGLYRLLVNGFLPFFSEKKAEFLRRNCFTGPDRHPQAGSHR